MNPASTIVWYSVRKTLANTVYLSRILSEYIFFIDRSLSSTPYLAPISEINGMSMRFVCACYVRVPAHTGKSCHSQNCLRQTNIHWHSTSRPVTYFPVTDSFSLPPLASPLDFRSSVSTKCGCASWIMELLWLLCKLSSTRFSNYHTVFMTRYSLK